MILDEIVANKRQEIDQLKKQYAGKDLKKLLKDLPQPRNFLKAFAKDKFSLIAEIKKASPAAGLIQKNFDPTSLAKTYEESGAGAISVLTDKKYFQGQLEHIKAAKDSTTLPILRKEFILDEAQIYEARIAGADAVLLIVKLLNAKLLNCYIVLAEELGMQALVETHNAEEVEIALQSSAKIIGINNRDLDSLKIDLNITIALLKQFPQLKERIVISESGIKTKQDIQKLKQAGVNGVLVGETILKSPNIPQKINELLGS